ncbi:single-stranded DNA-binding protein [Neisseria sp.]|uniref:single-stranded DNA-binding protein n=1 Tax=Neisseria sp. TaxID=192066 RepID=UPI0035A15DFA
MSSLNKVILIGNLGRDPETRYMPNGEAVCNFSIATSETWNDRNTGQRQERTEWHNITLYRRLAEIAAQYLRKGSSVYIEGRIQSRKYTGKDGIERTAYDIIGSEMKMLGSRNSGGSSAEYGDQGGYGQPAQQPYQNAPQQYQNAPQQYQGAPVYQPETPSAPPAAPRRQAPAAPAAPVDDIDDDIPF